jgi:hypothetical protein
MMKVIMKWIIFVIFLTFSVQGVSAAITVGPILIDPSGSLSSGTPVTVSFKIENSGVFPSDGELQMFTDLDNPEWTYTIIVNGMENLRPVMGGRTLTISGFELNYRTSDEVSVRVTLEGVAPAVTQTTDIVIVRITEYDGNGNPITIIWTDPVTITPINLKSKIGVFRPSTHAFYLDANGNGIWNGTVIDKAYGFGISTDLPVSGDWNNDGRTEIGVFRPSTHAFYLDANGNGIWNGTVIDKAYVFGISTDLPVSGDWNNDGTTDIGVFRPSTHAFNLDANGNGVWNGMVVDRVYNFGISGDIPVSGNWSSIPQPSKTIKLTKDLTIIPCTSVSIPVGGKII